MKKAGKKDVTKKRAKKPQVKKPGVQEHIGVRSPYALAETLQQRRINWSKWTRRDRKLILEGIFGRHFRDLFKPDPLTGGSPFLCPCTPPTTDCCPSLDWRDPGCTYKVDSFSGLDPVQGVACDCYFVAALSSVAWACRSRIKEILVSNQYKIQYYDEAISKWVDVLVSKSLPVDASGNRKYARSCTSGECWPSYYEKAFVGFKTRPAGSTTVTVDAPSMDILCQVGNALACLKLITGWAITASSQGRTDQYTCGVLWTKMRNLTNGTKTKYPVVAWSYTDAATAHLDTSIYPDYGIDTIIPKHAYSLLGVYTNNNINYVILRDPMACDGGDPDNTALSSYLGTGTWTYTDAFYLRAAAPDPQNPPSQKSLDLGILTDGVFALEICAFKAYFEGWAYVT